MGRKEGRRKRGLRAPESPNRWGFGLFQQATVYQLPTRSQLVVGCELKTASIRGRGISDGRDGCTIRELPGLLN